MIGASALFGAVQSVSQFRAGERGWLFINLAVLLVVALGVAAGFTPTGFLAGLLWGLLVLLPGSLIRRRQEALHALDFARAARFSSVIALLHPFDGQREYRLQLLSHWHEGEGRIDAAKSVLQQLRKSRGIQDLVELDLMRLENQFDKIVAHLKRQPIGSRKLQLASLYLRALGETRDLGGMWELYGQLPLAFANQPVIQLQLAAFSGLYDVVTALIVQHFPRIPRGYRDTWQATALLAQGRTLDGRELLLKVVAENLPGQGRAMHRLEYPIVPIDLTTLPAETLSSIDAFQRQVVAGMVAARSTPKSRRPYATLGLLTLLTVVFLLSIPGGSADIANLIEMGALVLPSELADGKVGWRIVAAGFLHYGVVHYGLNCLGLWSLGRAIEQLWNAGVLLFLFLGSNIGAYGYVALTTEASSAAPRVFLGASSGVMGLIGALGVFFLCGYLMRRENHLGQRFLTLLVVLAAQLLFDWFTPQVSSTLHLVGFTFGAILACPFAIHSWRRKPA